MIRLLDVSFYKNRTWSNPAFEPTTTVYLGPQWLELFDQNGYRLTLLEQEFSYTNSQPYVLHGDEKSLRKVWMESKDFWTSGPHVNHAFLFERKGYSEAALEQLERIAKENPMVYKLINYRGKWGVDFSMDYVDTLGNSMEIVHFEYDSYSLEEIEEIKATVEQTVLNTDWSDAAKEVLRRKEEWINLEFFDQSEWKTSFFGLPKERFKMSAWV